MDAGPRQLRPRDGAELERRPPRSPKIEVRRRLPGPLRARLAGLPPRASGLRPGSTAAPSHRAPPARRGRCRSRRRLPRPRAPSFGIARPRSGARRPCRPPRRAAGPRAGGRRRAGGRSVGATGDDVRRCRRPREPRPARTGAPAPPPRASSRGALRGRSAAGRSRPSGARRAERPVVRASCRRASRSAAGTSSGRADRNSSARARSNGSCGGSCQRIGPSEEPSRRIPDAKKFASGVRKPRSFSMCVM